MRGTLGSCYTNTAFALAVFSFVTCVIAFVTPHWLVSWEQKQSTFQRIGLWEVCFTAFSDPRLYVYRYYSGCWWIYHHELDDIRHMINPDWFTAVQVFSCLTLFTTIFSLAFLLLGKYQKSLSYVGYVGGATFAIITVVFSAISVIVFGSCGKDPQQYRLPLPQYNYYGAGFGMMILCCLSAGFCAAFTLGAKSLKSDEREDEKYRPR